ncbi:uncharacterized protein METZ01_LOCUS148329 [marine metagenome]|uniref:SnoaL-like domain-containing protein n=1 Tax=marine metagenome TaxID=408172 RepID=A0A382A1T2_9ZZZZ
MSSPDHAALARRYVELSNAHDLDRVIPMFDNFASYHSSQYGSFTGKQSIQEMMQGFFSGYPDVHWTVDAYTLETDNSVSFFFVMRATRAETDDRDERQGKERICFGEDGLITHIEVEVLSQ